MKSLKRLISAPVMLVLLTLMSSNMYAQDAIDLLLLQSLENPLEGTMVGLQASVFQSWREKGVLQVRAQHDGDATGSFRTMYDFDKIGHVTRKESDLRTQSISYDTDGRLLAATHE